MKNNERIFRVVAASLVGLGLAIQFVLILANPEFAGPAEAIVRYFSYFTILTNWLVAMALIFPALGPNSRWGAFFSSASVRGAVLIYILVVGIIYHLLLRSQWDPKGWQLAADLLLHSASPPLFAIDYFLWAPKRGLRLGDALKWLVFPAAFGAYTMAAGALTGFYPYSFLNVGDLGLAVAIRNLAGLCLVFFLIGVGLIGALSAGSRRAAGNAPKG